MSDLSGPIVSFGGLRIVVVPEPRPGYWQPAGRAPTKLQGRKGTRQAWKRKHPPRFVWPVQPLERGQILRSADTLFMRLADFADLKARLAQS